MAAKNKDTELNLRVLLKESTDYGVPADMPEVFVNAFDENGEYLSRAAFELQDGKTLKATVMLPDSMKNRVARLTFDARKRDIFEGVPPWMAALIQGRTAQADGNQADEDAGDPDERRMSRAPAGSRETAERLPSVSQAVREKRIRVSEDARLHEFTLHPSDWVQFLTCQCEVKGRLVRRVPLPDGTSKEVGICHACILIYEVDSVPYIIARLPEYELIRLRDDLLRLKDVFELPPAHLPDLVKPPFPPEPPDPLAAMGHGIIAEAAPSAAFKALGPQPEPPDSPAAASLGLIATETDATLDTVFKAGSSVALRNALLAAADHLQVYFCHMPWLASWYRKDLIRCVCTDEDGRFNTTIEYSCAGDKPDLYFKALQCIGGNLHVLYDPGVACHTHWNYTCGSEVVLETTDPAAMVCAPADPVTPPPGTASWIMPFGIGGIRLDRIDDATGLVDYVHPTSPSTTITISGAPFGATLGFRHGHSSNFPAPGMTHYRWLYKKEGSTDWYEFSEPVAAPVVRHYVDEDESDPFAPPTFPAYTLGPKAIGGKHLYEFRPEKPPQVPGHNCYWPTDNWFGDIYSGILRSANLPDGKYKMKLEIFSDSGTRIAPGAGTFRFIVPTGLASDGVTIEARHAYAGEIEDDGFVFFVHIDNSSCGAGIDGPEAGGAAADDVCGFLRYAATDEISIAYQATHPANFAYFNFWIRRGTQTVSRVAGDVGAASVTSSAGPAHSYAGDGSGSFAKTDFTPAQLLNTCPEAAFAEILRTHAKATNGWGRLHIYDAGFDRAFALAPKSS